MMGWLTGLTTLDLVFFSCAVIGGGLFVVRIVLMFTGVMGDADTGAADAGHADAVDVPSEAADPGHAHASDASFKMLSLQGISAFLMMFGLVGLAMSMGSGFGPLLSNIAAFAAGLVSVYVINLLFKGFGKLQATGNIDTRNAIGQEGIVYLKIPGGEPGKVQVTIQGRRKIMDAVSEDKTEIATESRVKIVGLVGSMLLVKKI